MHKESTDKHDFQELFLTWTCSGVFFFIFFCFSNANFVPRSSWTQNLLIPRKLNYQKNVLTKYKHKTVKTKSSSTLAQKKFRQTKLLRLFLCISMFRRFFLFFLFPNERTYFKTASTGKRWFFFKIFFSLHSKKKIFMGNKVCL